MHPQSTHTIAWCGTARGVKPPQINWGRLFYCCGIIGTYQYQRVSIIWGGFDCVDCFVQCNLQTVLARGLKPWFDWFVALVVGGVDQLIGAPGQVLEHAWSSYAICGSTWSIRKPKAYLYLLFLLVLTFHTQSLSLFWCFAVAARMIDM